MTSTLKSVLMIVLLAAAGAVLGWAVAQGYLGMRPAAYVEGDYASQRAETGQSVILLGTAWCGFCSKTREHLQARGVAFADLDVEHSKQAEDWLQALGSEGVPVVLIGDRQIRGFRPDVMDAALAALEHPAPAASAALAR